LTETPNMPSETHQSMLRRGSSNGLGLQAYEVAYKSMDISKTVMSGLVAVALILILGLALWLN
jgi:hypothetical protein